MKQDKEPPCKTSSQIYSRAKYLVSGNLKRERIT